MLVYKYRRELLISGTLLCFCYLIIIHMNNPDPYKPVALIKSTTEVGSNRYNATTNLTGMDVEYLELINFFLSLEKQNFNVNNSVQSLQKILNTTLANYPHVLKLYTNFKKAESTNENEEKRKWETNVLRSNKSVIIDILKTKSDPNITQDDNFLIENKNSCKIVVPNIFHLTWFYGNMSNVTFVFHKLMSVLSIVKIQKPEAIYFWHDSLPVGKWWNFLLNYVIQKGRTEIILKKMIAPTKIYNKTIIKAEHRSDIQRIKVLQEFGGIYIDLDVILLKSLTPLMCYNFTLGKEDNEVLNNGVILSIPNATFIKYWLDVYKTDFNPNGWVEASTYGATKVSKQHPELVHIEEDTINKPNYAQISLIYNNTLNWREKHYCLHLWYRFHPVEYDPLSIQSLQNTLGEIFRYIWNKSD